MADNILEYVLSLKDQISSKLQKIGVNNDTALEKFSKLEKQSNDVAKEFNHLGTTASTLQSKIALLKGERDLLPVGSLFAIRKYNSEINKLEKDVTKLQSLNGSKVKTWFKDALNGLPGIATNPLVLLGAGIGKAVKNGMEADMQKANILTLLKGDADKAKQLFQDLSNYGIKSPYDKAGLIEAQQTMMSFGLSADESFDKLKQIGDIAMGDSQRMQSLSLAFAQASSTGKLNGQDLNQMINAGFNPLLVISEKTGESMSSLKERMSKGQVTIEEVSNAFKTATSEGGDFYKAAENASNTLGGKWSNMMEALSELSLKVYEVVQPIISPLIGLVTSLVESIGSGIGWLINKIKEGNPIIIGIATVVGIFTAALILHNTYTAIATTFQNKLTIAVWKSNLAFLANPTTWIIATVIALIAVIAYLIMKIDGWGEMWQHTVNGAKLTFLAFVEYNKLAFTTLINSMMIGIDKIKLSWYKFKNTVGMGDKSENNKMIAQINADTEARKKAITDGAKKVKDLAVAAKNEFVMAGSSLKLNDKSFSDISGEIKSKLGISDPKTPGAEINSDNGTQTEDGKGQASKSNESIATGGQKNTTINITFKNMVEAMNITGKDFKESANNMSTELQDQMARVLAMAVTTAG